MEAVDKGTIESDTLKTFSYTLENKISMWRGRSIRKKDVVNGELGEMALTFFNKINSHPGVGTCSFLWGYFDPGKKEEQEFEIQMLIWAIHCQSPEEEERKKQELKALAKSSLKLGTLAALVIKRDYISASLTAGIFVLDVVDDCIRTVEEFKKHVKDRGKSFPDVRFYNWAEENERNRQDLIIKGVILEKDEASRHYSSNPHFTDNPHYTKPLC